MVGAYPVSVNLVSTVAADEVPTLHRLVGGGTGIGVISRYPCESEFKTERLVYVLPDWTLPAVPLLLVFPSRWQLAPAVRAFADLMGEIGAEAPSGNE